MVTRSIKAIFRYWWYIIFTELSGRYSKLHWDSGSPYKAMQVGGIGKNYAHNVLILLERTHENVGRKSLKLLTCIVL